MDFYPLNRVAKAEHLTRRRPRPLAVTLACGVVALGALNISAFIERGITEHRAPGVSKELGGKTLNILSWNTAGLKHVQGELQSYIREHDVRLFAGQEIYEDYADEIAATMPGSIGVHAHTDGLIGILDGGFGNEIVSAQPPDRYYMHVLEGDTDWPALAEGIITNDSSKREGAYQEWRSALVGIYKVKIGGHTVELQFMDTHAAQDSQREAIARYANSELNEKDAINMVVGDFNKPPEALRTLFKVGWVVADIGRTSVPENQQIDHVIYRPLVVLKGKQYTVNVDTQVIDKTVSDHYPILIKVGLEPIVSVTTVDPAQLKRRIIKLDRESR